MKTSKRNRQAVVAFTIAFLLTVVTGLLFVVPWPVHAQVPSITLDWTAPGDDGDVGTATTYEMRWATSRPDTTSGAAFTTWWNAATLVSNMPAPRVAGTAESVVVAPVGGFSSGRAYYFVLRSTDDVGNVAGFSNVAWKVVPDAVPPAPIIDLRVR